MRRIAYPSMGQMAIFFPAGLPKDGGTCAYAIPECLEGCPSCLTTNKAELSVLKSFRTLSPGAIAEQILEDIDYHSRRLNHRVLNWHEWGDCLPELIEKEVSVMRLLKGAGIVQLGFTRNKELWEKAPVAHNIRIGLSVVTAEEARDLSHKGLICWPEFSRGYARLFWKGKFITRCSGYWCIKPGKEPEACDCLHCYEISDCCFKDTP